MIVQKILAPSPVNMTELDKINGRMSALADRIRETKSDALVQELIELIDQRDALMSEAQPRNIAAGDVF